MFQILSLCTVWVGLMQLHRCFGGYTTSTVVGTGAASTSGNGGPALSATMNFPRGIWRDDVGVMYIAEWNGNIVRKVSTSGIITSFAGSGGTHATGTSANGDGGPAISATFKLPIGLFGVFDRVYITDYESHKVRFVYITAGAGSGTIHHLAGTGNAVSDGNNGPATSAGVHNPIGIFIDKNNVIYVTESFGHKVRRIDAFGQISAFMGIGTSSSTGDGASATACTFSNPYWTWGDTLGNMYVSDSGAMRVRKYTVSNGFINVFMGQTGIQTSSGDGGPASSATLKNPAGVIVDMVTNSVLVIEFYGHLIRAVSLEASRTVSLAAGVHGQETTAPTDSNGDGGPAKFATLKHPDSLILDTAGNVYFTDGGSNKVRLLIIDSPTVTPTTTPTAVPSARPTLRPTAVPTATPTTQPSVTPTISPSPLPTGHPSRAPTGQPSHQPSSQPSIQPTALPTAQPTGLPSTQPNGRPTLTPSVQPSGCPSSQPAAEPTGTPSAQPTSRPSSQPSSRPSCCPTIHPSSQPTRIPSCQPTASPSHLPSSEPSTQPTSQPSSLPTTQPSVCPSAQPTMFPSSCPTCQPTAQPTSCPSTAPSRQPSSQPTTAPSGQPTVAPSCWPSAQPSVHPSSLPTSQPSVSPSRQPSDRPSASPSIQPTAPPSAQPSASPSCSPSNCPSAQPTTMPTNQPSGAPSNTPSSAPSGVPVAQPSAVPSTQPSSHPTMVYTTVTKISGSVFGSVEASLSVTGAGTAKRFAVVLSLFYSAAPSVIALHPSAADIVLNATTIGSSHILYRHLNNSVTVNDASVSGKDFNSFVVSPAVRHDFSGRSVVALGDVNGDGYDDLLVGEPYLSQCYVLFGTALGYRDMMHGILIIGEHIADKTGWSVSSAGDVNNDGVDDIIIGAPFAKGSTGAVYILYSTRLSAAYSYAIHLNQLAPDRGFALHGELAGDYFGLSVGGAGDVDGDGFDDVAAGALRMNKFYSGAAHMVFGSNNTWRNEERMVSVRGTAWSYCGYSVSGVGDLNGDGLGDTAIGCAPIKENKMQSGPVYLMHGSANLTYAPLLSLPRIAREGGELVAVADFTCGGTHTSGIQLLVDNGGGFGSVVSNGPVGYVVRTCVTCISPSASPSEMPSVFPTVTPTATPVCAPSLVPSLAPTGPSRDPSVAPSGPSLSPTIHPTLAPAALVVASISPTTSIDSLSPITDKPTSAPSTASISKMPLTGAPTLRVRVPSRSPTRTARPTVRRTERPTVSPTFPAYSNTVYVSSAGAYVRPANATTHFIVNTTVSAAVSGVGRQSRFTIYPAPHTTLTIEYFDNTTDVIDLQAFPSLRSMADVRVSPGSAVIHVSEEQTVRLLNQTPYTISETNFMFNTTTVSGVRDPADANGTHRVIDDDEATALAIAGMLVLFVFFVLAQNAAPIWCAVKTYLVKQRVDDDDRRSKSVIVTFVSFVDGGEWAGDEVSDSSSGSGSDSGVHSSAIIDSQEWSADSKSSAEVDDMQSRCYLDERSLLSSVDTDDSFTARATVDLLSVTGRSRFYSTDTAAEEEQQPHVVKSPYTAVSHAALGGLVVSSHEGTSSLVHSEDDSADFDSIQSSDSAEESGTSSVINDRNFGGVSSDSDSDSSRSSDGCWQEPL